MLTWPESFKNQILNVNCLEVLPLIPDNAVDLILTDPPWNISYRTKRKVLEHFLENRSPEGYADFSKQWFAECHRVCKNIIFTPGIKNLKFWLNFEPVPKWVGACYTPNLKSHTPFNHKNCWNLWTPILFWGEINLGKDAFMEAVAWGIEGQHPCPRPLKIWKQLALACPEGGTILDPFMGSGTTALACKELGRNYVGMELVEGYCELAKKRLAQEMLI